MVGRAAELVEERALEYLAFSGVDVGDGARAIVSRLVEEEGQKGTEGLMGRVFDRLPEVIALAPLEIPPAVPPIHRASMCYDPPPPRAAIVGRRGGQGVRAPARAAGEPDP